MRYGRDGDGERERESEREREREWDMEWDISSEHDFTSKKVIPLPIRRNHGFPPLAFQGGG